MEDRNEKDMQCNLGYIISKLISLVSLLRESLICEDILSENIIDLSSFFQVFILKFTIIDFVIDSSKNYEIVIQTMPRSSSDRQLFLIAAVVFSAMNPNTVEIAQNQPQCSFYLCSNFGKVVLMSMPSTNIVAEYH